MAKDELLEKVLFALRQIIRAIDIHSRALVQNHGLTGPQLVILKTLDRLGEVPGGELARSVSLSHATVTGVLDRMERQGWVRRRRSEEDRRKVLVDLDQRGRDILETAPSLFQEQFAAEFIKLEDWEQTLILSSLQRIASMMLAREIVVESVLDSEPLPAATQEAVDVMSKSFSKEEESP
jgi:DNA-binding MarR family transcriptional regulator